MDFFNSRIHTWYSFYKRDLPWRNSPNPYFVWLSEIILQQTRVDQGLAYYLRFTEAFPTINDLADASEDQILKLWQGLGYYSRARNLHFTAKVIQKNYNSTFPSDYNSIKSLKGIGDYTAAAISSICFNMEYPAIDGNIYRVLSRYFGIHEQIDTNSGKKVFQKLAKELITGTDPGMHNQALMEFGALQCTPKNPDCQQCPLKESCFAHSHQAVSKLPIKQNRTKQRNRHFNYLIIECQNYTWLRKRTTNDIWKGLFEFPLIEMSEATTIDVVLAHEELQKLISHNNATITYVGDWKIHLLSHQRIHYRFIRISLSEEIETAQELIRINKQDIFNFAVPKLLENCIAEYFEN